MSNRIFQTLDSKEYDFLRNDKVLGEHILYGVLSGSHGYGTSTESSDIDLRGFIVEPSSTLFMLENFEQYEDKSTDTVLFGLKKFISLALQGNPNILELLGVPENCIYIGTPAGLKIRENSEYFLSRRIIQSFGGYAMAQLRRLQNALAHDSYDASLREQHILQTLVSQLDYFNQTYTSFPEGNISLYLNEEKSNILMDINLQGYPLRDFTSIYSGMTNTIRSYEKLTHRNNKKEEGKLFKHAMHLIRLLITGKNILEGKGITTRLEEDLPLLLDIRKGNYSFDAIFEMIDVYEQAFQEAVKHTDLPEVPNKEAVQELMYETYRDFYGITKEN